MTEAPLNAAIAPAVVLASQADNEGRDHLPHPRPTDASGRVGPLPGDQTPMPTHQRIRGDEGGNRVQRPSPEALGLHRQSTTLIVSQPELPATQLLFEDPVLLDQVGDNILLMPMHPAGNRQQQQLERESRGRHPAIVGALKSHVWRAVTDRSIFRTGRGSQFTSVDFTNVLKETGIRISMDGKGRWMDNVFIERLWRSLKYECVYLSEFATGSQARTGIGWWMDFYNRCRPHSALNDRTPAEAYTDDGADTSPGLCPGSRQPKVA